RTKGWVERWLEARVHVITTTSSPRAELRSHPRKYIRPKRGRISGPSIRFARSNIYPPWSQGELAKELRISRAYLSQLEAGKRKPSQQLCTKIRTWLDKREQPDMAPELETQRSMTEFFE